MSHLPIVVCGGGPCGLLVASALARADVECVVVCPNLEPEDDEEGKTTDDEDGGDQSRSGGEEGGKTGVRTRENNSSNPPSRYRRGWWQRLSCFQDELTVADYLEREFMQYLLPDGAQSPTSKLVTHSKQRSPEAAQHLTPPSPLGSPPSHSSSCSRSPCARGASVWKRVWNSPQIRFSDGTAITLSRPYAALDTQRVNAALMRFLRASQRVTLIDGKVERIDAREGVVHIQRRMPSTDSTGTTSTLHCRHVVDATGPRRPPPSERIRTMATESRSTSQHTAAAGIDFASSSPVAAASPSPSPSIPPALGSNVSSVWRWQRFVGIHIRTLRPHGMSLDECVVCDFTQPPPPQLTMRTTSSNSAISPTQLYVLPYTSHELFAEEFNILLSPSPPSWTVYEQRLRQRLKKFEPYEILHRERFTLPLVAPVTSTGSNLSSSLDCDVVKMRVGKYRCGVTAVGAAAGFIHSPSGFQLAFGMEKAFLVAQQLIEASQRVKSPYASIPTISLLSPGERVASRLFLASTAYLERLHYAPRADIELYFREFFQLPTEQWSALWARSGPSAAIRAAGFSGSLAGLLRMAHAGTSLLGRLPRRMSMQFIRDAAGRMIASPQSSTSGNSSCSLSNIRCAADTHRPYLSSPTRDSSLLYPVATPLPDSTTTTFTDSQRMEHVLSFAFADDRAGISVVLVSFILLVCCELLLRPASSTDCSFLVAFLWMFVRAGITVRFTAVYHDVLHSSLLSRPAWNQWVGWLVAPWIGVNAVEFTKDHLRHHAHLNQLHGGKEPINFTDSIYFTRREYNQASPMTRLLWRILRDPFIFFTLSGPLLVVFGHYVVRSASLANCAGIGFLLTQAAMRSGWRALMMELGALYFTSMVPLLLSHWMHAANPGYVVAKAPLDRTESWSPRLAAVLGSTVLQVPWFLSWSSLGLEYHALHHLCSRVPCYHLSACWNAAPPAMFADVTQLAPFAHGGMTTLLNCMWDEDQGRFVPFDQYQTIANRMTQPKRGELARMR